MEMELLKNPAVSEYAPPAAVPATGSAIVDDSSKHALRACDPPPAAMTSRVMLNGGSPDGTLPGSLARAPETPAEDNAMQMTREIVSPDRKLLL